MKFRAGPSKGFCIDIDRTLKIDRFSVTSQPWYADLPQKIKTDCETSDGHLWLSPYRLNDKADLAVALPGLHGEESLRDIVPIPGDEGITLVGRDWDGNIAGFIVFGFAARHYFGESIIVRQTWEPGTSPCDGFSLTLKIIALNLARGQRNKGWEVLFLTGFFTLIDKMLQEMSKEAHAQKTQLQSVATISACTIPKDRWIRRALSQKYADLKLEPVETVGDL